MPNLDDTDLEILELLMADARRPYSDIAAEVDLSGPAVSDRVSRLEEMGVIQGFTLDIDRSQLRGGVPVLIELAPATDKPGTDSLASSLRDVGAVEHVFQTASGNVVIYATVPDTDVRDWLHDTLETPAFDTIDVTLLADAAWSPTLGETEFALSCAQCGNTVDHEGTSIRIDGDRYQFCCPSCESRFLDKYEQIEAGAD